MKQPDTDNLRSPVLDAGGKTGGPGEQAWTGNRMHVSAGTENLTRESLVQMEGRHATLTCFPNLLLYRIVYIVLQTNELCRYIQASHFSK